MRASESAPPSAPRASEEIYARLRAGILSGEFRPGDRLPSERSLMETMHRSRPTIREALRMLEHGGLIHTVPGVTGAVVCAPGTREAEQSLMDMLQASRVTISELAEYRMANETALARWAAARRSPEHMRRLEENLREAGDMLRGRDFHRFIAQDSLFHRRLAEAAGNTVASLLARAISRLTEPKMHEAVSRRSEAENTAMCTRILSTHRLIADAVHAGDPDRAEAAMAGHIRAFWEDLGESAAPAGPTEASLSLERGLGET